MSCGVGRRRGSDPVLLSLWYRLAGVAPIRPLSWEPPHHGCGPKQQKKKKDKKKERNYAVQDIMDNIFWVLNEKNSQPRILF